MFEAMFYCLGTYNGCVSHNRYVRLISTDGFLVINVPPNNANVRPSMLLFAWQ